MTDQEGFRAFSEADIDGFKAAMKVGLIATINSEGLPHLTLIASLQANTPTQMIFGQFVEGLSKKQIHQHPKVGFLVMTLDKEVWRGTATFTHTAQHGPEFEMYNNTPMFRYNAYFGIHTVYFLDLAEHSGKQALPMNRIIMAAVQTLLARKLSRKPGQKQVLNLWTRQLMNKLDNLKFLAHIGTDGYPVIIPVIQAQAADSEHIIFSLGAYKDDLQSIAEGTTVAVFGMSLEMEDVLMRGEYLGMNRMGGVRCGSVKVNWVYNPMPPKPQQIYPPINLEPLTTF